MKYLQTFALLFSLLAPRALAGTATLFSDAQSNSSASGSGTVIFNSYNATSITITVSASAYGGSQQGGGRNYSGAAVATIGSSEQREDVPNGSDPLSVGANNSLTVTKGGDGKWYANGVDMGSGIGVSASAYVDGENAQGGATATAFVNWVAAPANNAPTIAWTTAPATATSGVAYTITAHGHDADGNLTQVNVWKNGQAFAFGGGGNGTDGDSGNSSSDPGPATVTFTAQAVDASGATSSTISHTITVAAPNSAPTIAWSSSPAVAVSGGSYTITARGHDSDGNLTQVNVWKNGQAFAFSGGGNGTEGTSGNATADTGPASITYTAQAVDASGASSPTISHTVSISAANAAPTISWINAPASAASGSSYAVTARGHDADGNLTQVSVWKNGQAFALAGGGNGTDGDSGNTTSDTGPASITYTARAVDASGATSATISLTVTVTAANTAPTIVWTSSPGSVPSGQNYTVSARGHDADGNLSQVNVWKNGSAFAMAGGGNGTDGDSGNPTSDPGPATVTYTANAVDASGATSGTITQTVTVAAPLAVSAAITASPTTATTPGTTTVTWTSHNAVSVEVSGSGLNSTAPGGSQTISGLSAGTHTFTITALGIGGPVTQSATVIVTTPGAVTATIGASPSAASAPASTVISWSSTHATAVSVTGLGLNSAAVSGSQTVSGLGTGRYDYVITAQGPGGPVTQTTTVNVAAATVTASISASPAAGTEPGTTSISWTTTNSTAVSVAGPGLNSAAAAGTQTVSGLGTGTHTFTITAQGPGGPVTQSTSFVVSAAPPPITASISATPDNGIAPAATTVAWNSTNAASVSVSGPGLSSTAPAGNQMVTGLPAGTHLYSLTAQGSGGPITRTAAVTVTSGPAVTATLSVSPAVMNVGDTATLTWSTAHATSVRVTGAGITGSPFQDSPNLIINVAGLPAGQSTWTLIAEGAGGPIIRTATLMVNSIDGLTGSLVISPTVIYSNQSATLTWTSVGANFRWVHGFQPDHNGVSVSAAPENGSTNVAGLEPGEYSFVFEYGPGAFSATRGSYAYLTVLGMNRTVLATATPAGTGSVSGGGTFAEGSSVTLTATADPHHLFTGWSGDLTGSTNPLTFLVGARNYSVTANFAPRSYTVAASTAPVGAGSVTGTGTYTVGTTATLTATPDATHTFTGWTGDLSSSANPLVFVVNGNTSVAAQFASTNFVLTTVASPGGGVTPGGTYPEGTVVTLTATPDATHRFANWSGDGSGTGTTTAVTMDRSKILQANFVDKAAQTISFDPPGDHALGAPPFALTASASSGLPVSFSLLSGPALLIGATVELIGAGPVTVAANQPGDAFYLPATTVSRTFNATATATLKYRGQARTILGSDATRNAPPFVLERP